MTELKTEEEQIEAFKKWWKKNGTSLVLAIAVAVAGYFGFQTWSQGKVDHVNEASVLFESLNNVITELSDPKKAQTASFIADQLTTDYDDTGYATFGYLYQAKIAVEAGDLDTALAKLDVAKESAEDVSIKAVADLQAVKILLNKKQFTEALERIELVTLAEFSGQKHEVKGDILLAQGNKEDARIAYQMASDAFKGATVPTPLLDIKLKDLVGK